MERDDIGVNSANRAIAVVGLSAILPDSPNVEAFWQNVLTGKNSIGEVPADRWNTADYWNPDASVPDKSYSKIGAFVKNFTFDSLKFRIPPKVATSMDVVQQWMLVAARDALLDAGHPDKANIDPTRTAVVLGNALGGEKHEWTNFRVVLPEVKNALEKVPEFQNLPAAVREACLSGMLTRAASLVDPITEDTMPGELSNVIAGRVANVFDLCGPNFTCDAACASSLAALQSAVSLLVEGKVDTVLTGGVDRTMGPPTYVKFSKIGALSVDGSRPFDAGANGFVMGEGCICFVLRRLEDAERDGNKIYAVIRGIGGASDGKGKGITAPNPQGQLYAIERAYQDAGYSPATVSLIEAHGTSTSVGDAVELEALTKAFDGLGLPNKSIAIGSIKSQIGHLKSAAGAASLLKSVLALHHKTLPPSINFKNPNPKVAWDKVPFFVNTEAKAWERPACGVRRAGVSSFGFGGTNFHISVEEYLPGMLADARRSGSTGSSHSAPPPTPPAPAPLRGVACFGAQDVAGLKAKVAACLADAQAGTIAPPQLPKAEDLKAPERLVIDYGTPAELIERCEKALTALDSTDPRTFRALRGRGVFRGSGAPEKVAFLFPGQGSQYIGMLKVMRERVPEVRAIFEEADRIMADHLPKKLSEYIFDDAGGDAAVAALVDTKVCQPAVLTIDAALMKMLTMYGIKPDMVTGHSLGEYGALVACGAMPFADALLAVSARAKEMASVSIADCGKMASIFAPYEAVEKVLKTAEGYVVPANVNSRMQTVIGGASKAVEAAVAQFQALGAKAVFLPVSHAFHTEIVAPASGPLRSVLSKLHLRGPQIPLISNVTGGFYPTTGDLKEQMLDLLARQIYSPVQFVKGLETLYATGARIFVEVGPKKVLASFVEDVLSDKTDVVAMCTNHPKKGEIESFSEALCALYATGHGACAPTPTPVKAPAPVTLRDESPRSASMPSSVSTPTTAPAPAADQGHLELGKLFANFLQNGMSTFQQHFGGGTPTGVSQGEATPKPEGSIVISGASLGLPGRSKKVFEPDNFDRIMRGENCIDPIDPEVRAAQIDKHVIRLNKSSDGSARIEELTDVSETLKLAGQRGIFDLTEEFGISKERREAFDITTELAIGAAILALKDAGIPLVRRYKTTSLGTKLPDRWVLPESMADETGIIFSSAYPGLTTLIAQVTAYEADKARRTKRDELKSLRVRADGPTAAMLDLELVKVEAEIAAQPFHFDRRFLFHILAMGHSQLAELIGARGPNTQVNSACASNAEAVAIATDWIRLGRCRRVIVVGSEDITSGDALRWFSTGFLASGAATTEGDVTQAALPFDVRRRGMIMGMGASGLVLEAEDAVRERGMRGIVEVLHTEAANSAFHGSRLDIEHLCGVMERMLSSAERKYGIDRAQIAPNTVFVSHETYTPARGGSASAEIHSLRRAFGPHASKLLIANTKGFTGHPMGGGLEESVAVKILETGKVPPIANYSQPDPELGDLRLSRGGSFDAEYAIRFGAGFGSQIVISLFKKVPGARVASPTVYQSWLNAQSGQNHARTEVVQNTLRIVDDGVPPNAGAKSTWTSGEPPRLKADGAPTGPSSGTIPAPTPPRTEAPRATPVAAKPVAPVPATSTPPANDTIAEKVLDVVAQKTGYPREMLALDLDLEADLGIDTVKQAEIFGEVRTAFDVPRRDDLKLRDYPTLGAIINLMRASRPDLAPTTVAPPPPSSAAPTQPAATPAVAGTDLVAEKLLSVVAEKTGYPREMLALDLDLEADLGIDTVKQAEIFGEVRTAFDIPRNDELKLRDYPTLNALIGLVHSMKGTTPVAASPAPASVASVTPAAAPAIAGEDPVAEKLLAVVAEKTGYPREMLDKDLDLEADLGIDTVKQAEIFGEVRTAFDIPRNDELKLRDYPTLNALIGLVHSMKGTTPVAMAAPASAPLVAPVAPPASTPVSADASDPVAEKLLAVVAEKTGYPREMLDKDLDLEADLGIDTVKQAEIFGEVRTAFDIPRNDELKLRDYPTLNALIGLVHSLKGNAPQATASASPTASEATPVEAPGSHGAKRRVPTPVVRPSVDFCKPTGVELRKGMRVVVVPDKGGVAPLLTEALTKKGVEVLELSARMQVVKNVETWLKDGPIDGVYNLTALDVEPALVTIDAETAVKAFDLRVKRIVDLCRALLPHLGKAGTFLVAATRMGGQLGYGAEPASAPMGGAVSGFTKAFGRECPEACSKVVDFELTAEPKAIASALIDETLRDNGTMEIGYAFGNRHTLTLVETAFPTATDGLPFNQETVFVVTGAAGGITSAITQDLAKNSKGVFWLLDLAPMPDGTNPHIAKLADRDALRKEIFEEIKAKGERATPAAVEKIIGQAEREAAIINCVKNVEKTGARAFYRSVNACDPEAVAKVVEEIRKAHGKIDALVHAAGMERSKLLADKTNDEYNLIFDVKVFGLLNLLRAAQGMPIHAMICFTSIAGRFGNLGQTDYSAANDFLCKAGLAIRQWRPETKAMACDWTAWGGVGMAMKGSLPEIMKRSGIDMLDPRDGVPVVGRELMAGSRGEAVFGGALGMMMEPRDAAGGLDLAAIEKQLASKKMVMVGHVKALDTYQGLCVETELDPAKEPFLHDHVIEGSPVLPGVMGIEGFVEVASLLLPEYRVAGLENVRFEAPMKYYRNQPRPGLFRAQMMRASADEVRVDLTFSSTRTLATGAVQETRHYSGQVVMTRAAEKRVTSKETMKPTAQVATSDIYKVYFHGPAYQVLDHVEVTEEGVRSRFKADLPPAFGEAGVIPLLAPRIIEQCLQTAGIYELGKTGRMALPAALDKVVAHATPKEIAGLWAEVLPRVEGEGLAFDGCVKDDKGRVYLEFQGYRTSAMPSGLPEELMKPLRAPFAGTK